jgi:hypothetical protein
MRPRIAGRNIGLQAAIPNSTFGVVTLSYPGSANTWGAWSTAIAAMPYAARGLYLNIVSNSNGANLNVGVQLEVGLGTAGNEVGLIRAFVNNHGLNQRCNQDLWVPLAVPAGVRVAVRMMASGSSSQHAVSVVPFPCVPGAPPGFRGVEIVGLSASQALPTIVAAGTRTGSAPEFIGAVVQMTAATAQRWRAVTVCFGGNGVLTASVAVATVRLLVGPAASEQVVVSPVWSVAVDRGQQLPQAAGWEVLPCDIPKGSRVAMEIVGSASEDHRPYLFGWY